MWYHIIKNKKGKWTVNAKCACCPAPSTLTAISYLRRNSDVFTWASERPKRMYFSRIVFKTTLIWPKTIIFGEFELAEFYLTCEYLDTDIRGWTLDSGLTKLSSGNVWLRLNCELNMVSEEVNRKKEFWNRQSNIQNHFSISHYINLIFNIWSLS